MKYFAFTLLSLVSISLISCTQTCTTEIPLPEHPRPDFNRTAWVNLNGQWNFTFDQQKATEAIENKGNFNDQTINVPFSWGCQLSGIQNPDEVKGWYNQTISIPDDWADQRVFLVIGAAEYETEVWIDGEHLGKHRGGYMPFEYELTGYIKGDATHSLIISCDDSESCTQFGDESTMHLFGKQEYGNVAGIWQTVYLEARGNNYIKYVHFTPDIDNSKVMVDIELGEPTEKAITAQVAFPNGDSQSVSSTFTGQHTTFEVPLQNQHLWNLDDPYLYDVTVSLSIDDKTEDMVNTYFGQRKISVVDLPGTDFPYIALNDKPVYMQLTLDQSYHREGFYTFPTDQFMKGEIELSKRLGLTGNRIHIKAEMPRKLYWADRLGLLIMADIPNFWGAPVPEAKADWEQCMRAQVERDYNHPSIFAWINFNETWGLQNVFANEDNGTYTPENQEWCVEMYHLTKSLDPSRLVEDNSACNNDHTETDLNTWHKYRPSYLWEETISEYVNGAFEGSTHNFYGGRRQAHQPMLNSECGNVWGYTGSAGDSDFSWDYHAMVNTFRKYPKCAGFLYTEHHDVLNEWNGYVRYDRSPKYDGMSELMPDMTMADLHSPYYIFADTTLNIKAIGGQKLSVPLRASYMTDKDPGSLTLRSQLVSCNQLGQYNTFEIPDRSIAYSAWGQYVLDPLEITLPEEKGVYVLRLQLVNQNGEVKHRNFTTITVEEGKDITLSDSHLITFQPSSYTSQQWTLLQKDVMDGLKVNGFGNGYFEYEVTLPEDIDIANIKSISLLAEVSAKKLLGKDITDDIRGLSQQEFISGRGTKDPTAPPNASPMTDDVLYPSRVIVSVNGIEAGTYEIQDEPADHRGILSWGAQKHDNTLKEAGTYGYLMQVELPSESIDRKLTIRFTVPSDVNSGEGGLAIYGASFGRYPLDPTLIIKY